MEISDIESIINQPKMIDEIKYKLFVKDLINNIAHVNFIPTIDLINLEINKLRSKYKINPSKSQMRYIIEKFFSNHQLNNIFNNFLIKKACRSRSGVLVSTIVLKPDKFSCPKKCSYCPTETDLNGNPTQPKSYLSSEPAMLRALQYNFNIREQLWDRIKTYIKTGNIKKSDSQSYKLEIILSGGTWESYSYSYRNSVMNELYWGANTFNSQDREIKSIEEEIKINETATYRVIGLTIETRPDFITKTSIRDYRKWGVTRVQIGVQHYDDTILDKINRETHTYDTMKAIRMLKQCGFKIVCHLMPDLPGSTPELDKWMFTQAINNTYLQFDDVKIYPTAVCQTSDSNLIVKSDIAEWYKEGSYIPYAEKNINDLIDVLIYYKTNIQPWVRIQRLIRDIPAKSIEAGYKKIGNLRQIIHDKMKTKKLKCNCVRCMEIGENNDLLTNARLVVRKYRASCGDEYWITIESNKKILFDFNYLYFIISYWIIWLIYGKITFWSGNLKTYNGLIGFCRLRLDPNPGENIIKEINNCALIREVHVYGYSLGITNNDQTQKINQENKSQHRGYGQLLVKTAEIIAKQNNYKKIAVIAGIGTREYYKNKCGYYLDGTYMIKQL